MKRVLIVGGGSAGWITACLMDALLNPGSGPKRVAFTLVEAPAIGRVGVGEATIPSILATLRRIGVDEADFLRAAGATFKQGISFEDWAEPGHRYFHPFDAHRPGTGFDGAGAKWIFASDPPPFAETVSAQPALARLGRGPKTAAEGNYKGVLSYAYHMDAEAFAERLAEIARGRGVVHRQDQVVDIEVAGPDRVAAVRVASGERMTADLYIDCTGFASRLASGALGSRFMDFGEWLLCDRAVTLRVPHLAPDQPVRPYTSSKALSAGWRWDIGLQTRRGTGYVYSSRFITDDDAERELRQVEGLEDFGGEARFLRFRTGCLAEQWRGNCVAIGLSAGFIEPLESTGLYLIEYAAQMLAEHFPFVGETDALAANFNELMERRFEECLSFIALHYCLTRRHDTPFWREVQKPQRIPPRLRALLELWEAKPPTPSDFRDTHQIFGLPNWEYILFGMGWRPQAATPEARTLDLRIPAPVRAAAEALSSTLPPHEILLRDMLARA